MPASDGGAASLKISSSSFTYFPLFPSETTCSLFYNFFWIFQSAINIQITTAAIKKAKGFSLCNHLFLPRYKLNFLFLSSYPSHLLSALNKVTAATRSSIQTVCIVRFLQIPRNVTLCAADVSPNLIGMEIAFPCWILLVVLLLLLSKPAQTPKSS